MDFLNTNMAIPRQLMIRARTLAVVLWGSVGTVTKEDESSTGRVWAAGFHHVTGLSRLACVLKLVNRLSS
jgi:hypothetical protein